MLGNLYDRALDGERCWLRHDDGRLDRLPIRSWLGGRKADQRFDHEVVGLCEGPTIDLGCGPGRLVAHLIQRGVPALGVDQSATAVALAHRSGAPALRRDVFDPLPGTGRWHNVLLADGNVGLGGDPWRILRRAGELLRPRRVPRHPRGPRPAGAHDRDHVAEHVHADSVSPRRRTSMNRGLRSMERLRVRP